MTDKLVPVSEVLGRILLAALFIPAGFSKISGYEGTQGYMEAMGVPGMLLPLVILFEIGGGLLLIAGYQTRLIAAALAGFCVVSGFIFHFQPADQIQMILFMKNIAIAGGFLLLVAHGAGDYSLDVKLKHRKFPLQA
ncbi:DoxX family protein [Sneathiella glossodoripedis]|uniref:DoxX family protein n=1 Tax=Sneathiella glossodoripedis TaxID=418853 RepID=UPI0004707C2E|nr:DoxX family protein [Sneathiella glossodoripedis]